MKLSVGPLPYLWPRVEALAFYDMLASAPVDIVYLGETVCARRHELRLPDWLAIAETLSAAGKEVVLSTQTLLESKSDITLLQRITGNGRFLVEANDMGAVHLLADRLPFVAGPSLNLYNEQSVQLLGGLGACRWVMPFEMSRANLAQILASGATLPETEVFVHGRMPLAHSARCFTARHHDLPKDDCRFSCLADADGLLLKTREGEDFLVLNGIQTQSARYNNLLDALDDMRDLGVSVVRIAPQSQHMVRLIDGVSGVLAGRLAAVDVQQEINSLLPTGLCNGFWHGAPGLEWHVAQSGGQRGAQA